MAGIARQQAQDNDTGPDNPPEAPAVIVQADTITLLCRRM